MSVSTSFDAYKPLLVEKDDSTGLRILQRDFKIIVNNEMIVVPRGFDTDYSSYPWLTRSIVRFDRVDVAGVVHDYLYRTQIKSRSEADKIWRMIACHGQKSANGLQGWVSWIGLRIGGWVPWKKHKKNVRVQS